MCDKTPINTEHLIETTQIVTSQIFKSSFLYAKLYQKKYIKIILHRLLCIDLLNQWLLFKNIIFSLFFQ